MTSSNFKQKHTNTHVPLRLHTGFTRISLLRVMAALKYDPREDLLLIVPSAATAPPPLPSSSWRPPAARSSRSGQPTLWPGKDDALVRTSLALVCEATQNVCVGVSSTSAASDWAASGDSPGALGSSSDSPTAAAVPSWNPRRSSAPSPGARPPPGPSSSPAPAPEPSVFAPPALCGPR